MPFDPDVNEIRITIYHKKQGKRTSIYRQMVNCDEIWAVPIDCNGLINGK